MRLERLSKLLKSMGFVDCDECQGCGLDQSQTAVFGDDSRTYPTDPPDCAACEGSGVVRRMSESDVSLHDDFRPEAP